MDHPDSGPTTPAQVSALLDRIRYEEGVSREQITRAPRPSRIGRGWDNTQWHVGALEDGTRVVLRVPERQLAREILPHEIALLGDGASLPPSLPFSRPRLLGQIPTDAPGGPAALLTWIEGHVVAELVRSTPGAAPDLAEQLAIALAALHRPAPDGHPRGRVRGVPLVRRGAAVLAELPLLDRPTGERVRRAWEQGLGADVWDGPDLLLHGDPHPGNLVVPAPGSPREDTTRLGLIDWGDTCAGDPASDLGALFHLDPSGGALGIYLSRADWAREADARTRDALVLRARAWAARYAAAILSHPAHAEETTHAALEASARRMIDGMSAHSPARRSGR
ncbi:phosphotransferase [Brachybacterium halotolerans subsp. kimchii]|uniref:phosphotransferase n=1 Tax=Brachybacterium halotolerans TaxID=2795215 RepID=UPI001E51A301|nr:phosphotransferase [Brachybacterium halotolerans]UEJ82693.1 phosphotransferase [Brachybacterium halotolerans subsp. kimchii]